MRDFDGCSIFAHMASRSTEAIGRRVRQAREDSGLTQAELAQGTSLERSALAKIESGTRNISALELSMIAQRLGLRIDWFLVDAPQAVLSRRDSRDVGAPSPTVDKLTERIAREVEFVMEHDERLADMASPPSLPRPTDKASVEHAASEARHLLGIDPKLPLHDLSRHVGEAGLLVFSLDLGTETIDGASMLLRYGGVAVVNGARRAGRRRLTIAHEFGHFLFADEFSLDWQIGSTDQPRSREARIDHFARALLLPAEGLRDTWGDLLSRGHSARETAIITASQFRVDMSTLARRLSDLRMADRNEAQRVRGYRTTRADIVDFDLLNHDELRPPELPLPYIEAVLRIYRREVISAARALDLLLETWDEADLPELPSLPEEAIWSFVS